MVLVVAGLGALPAPAAGASYSFAFASGFTLPTAFDCTTATGCSAGAGGAAHGQFEYPKGAVVVGSEVFVIDHYNARVEVFDTATRTYQRSITADGHIGGPAGIATDGTNLYVTAGAQIAIVNAATGALVRLIGKNVGGPGVNTCTSPCQDASEGFAAGELRTPIGIDNYAGDIYVSDYLQRRVNVFNAATGAFVKAFGKDVNTSGSGNPDLCTAATGCETGDGSGAAGAIRDSAGLAVSSSGLIFVTEGDQKQRVSIWNADTGAFVKAIGRNVNPSGLPDPDVCTAATTCQGGTADSSASGFSYPISATADGSTVYVTDPNNSRIKAYDGSDGTFLFAVGKGVNPDGSNRCTVVTGCQSGQGGSGAGQLSGPYGAGVGGGKVYVADTDNHRVVVYDLADGAFDHAFGFTLATGPCTTVCARGASGNTPGKLNRAFGAAVYNGEVLVPDGANARVTVFNAATGAYSRTFDTNGSNGGLAFPVDVEVDGTHAYVAEGNGDRISVWDAATGTFERAFGKNVGGAGVDTCTSSCNYGTRGTGAGFMQASYGVAVGGGYVFVGDQINRRVDQFTTAGAFVRAFGVGVNSGAGDPNICTTSCQAGTGSVTAGLEYLNGEVYVPQLEKAMINVYDPATGALVRAFGKNVGGSAVNTCTSSCVDGTANGSAGAINFPWDIAFLGGNAYISDAGNRRVSVFNATTGAFQFAIGKDVDSLTADDFCTTNCTSGQWSNGAPGGLLEQRGLAVGPDGTVYVADDSGHRLAAFTTPDDLAAPTTTDNVPAGYQNTTVTVTLTASDGGSGVDKTYYTTGANPGLPTTSSTQYNPAAKPTLADGEKIRYFSTDLAGNAETPRTSSAALVDEAVPSTADNVPSGAVSGAVTVTLTATDSGGSGVDKTYYTTGVGPGLPTTSSNVYNPAAKPTLADGEKIRYFSTDRAGNAETPRSSTAVHVVTTTVHGTGDGTGSGSGGQGTGTGSGSGGQGTGTGSGGSGGGGSSGEDPTSGESGGTGSAGSAPCVGKRGDARRKCRAFVDYRAFMAKCDVLNNAEHQRSCVKRAKRAYKQSLALIKCRKLAGRARKRCERQARGIR